MALIASTARPSKYRGAFARGLSFHQLSLGGGHLKGPAARRDLDCAGHRFSELVEQKQVAHPRIQAIARDETLAALEAILKQRAVGKLVMGSG